MMLNGVTSSLHPRDTLKRPDPDAARIHAPSSIRQHCASGALSTAHTGPHGVVRSGQLAHGSLLPKPVDYPHHLPRRALPAHTTAYRPLQEGSCSCATSHLPASRPKRQWKDGLYDIGSVSPKPMLPYRLTIARPSATLQPKRTRPPHLSPSPLSSPAHTSPRHRTTAHQAIQPSSALAISSSSTRLAMASSVTMRPPSLPTPRTSAV